jgi:two-component system, cell cycle response regulator
MTDTAFPNSNCVRPSVPRARVLLVEDNAGDAEIVRMLLEYNEMTPMEVVHCTRLSKAISLLHDQSFHIIMLDLGLPDSQHLDTLKQIQLAARMVPIVVLTGQDDLELSKQSIRMGAQECLSKGQISGGILVRMISNAIERHIILTEVTDRAITDELTGLYNRRGLRNVAQSFYKATCRLGVQCVLLYADLDGLKSINDTLGHDVGDKAICETANLLRGVFRDSDILCRLGGDEFAVLAFGAGEDNCDLLVSRIENAVMAINQQSDRLYRLSISVGAVEIDPKVPFSLEQLLLDADGYMYNKKRSNPRRNVVLSNLVSESSAL